MSIVTRIIDIIKSRGSLTRVDNLMEYKASYVEADMQQNTLVPWRLVQSVLQEDIVIKIVAGSNPTTLTNGSDFVSPSLLPIVLQAANPTYPSLDDTMLTTEGQSLRVDYIYADNDLDVLIAIDVWVADNTVDTWLRII